jgi:hypothetical protein
MQTIHADGIDWPLGTFIDAYQMRRADGDYPAFSSGDTVIDYVNDAGQLITRKRANAVEWGRVIAYRLPDHSPAMHCLGCDEIIEHRYDWCDYCLDDGQDYNPCGS